MFTHPITSNSHTKPRDAGRRSLTCHEECVLGFLELVEERKFTIRDQYLTRGHVTLKYIAALSSRDCQCSLMSAVVNPSYPGLLQVYGRQAQIYGVCFRGICRKCQRSLVTVLRYLHVFLQVFDVAHDGPGVGILEK